MSQQQIMVVLGADVSDLSKAMAMIQGQVRQTANAIEKEMNEAERSVKESTSGMARHFDSLKGVMGGIGKSFKVSSIVSGLSSAVPILATATAGAGALGSAFLSAGVGVAGFGAVAVANLNDVFSATDETFHNLSAEQKKAYKDLKGFKSFWGDFAKEFEKPTMEIFSKGLGVTKEVLTAIKPAIQGTAKAINGLMDSFSQSLKSDDMMVFFDFINETAGGMVERFGKIFGNTFMGISNLMVGFAPLANELMNGLVGMTDKFVKWSSAFRDSTGLQMFMDYVRTNTPVVMGLIGDISSTVMNLLITLAPLGQSVLGVLGKISGALSAFSQEFKNAFAIGNVEGAGVAISNLVSNLISILTSSLPQMIGAGIKLVSGLIQGITQNIPQIVTSVVGLLQAALTSMNTNYPLFINAGLQLLMALISGIISSLPQLISSATQVIQTLATTLMDAVVIFLPQLVQSAIQLALALIQGIVQSLPLIMQSAVNLISVLVGTFLQQLPVILNAGIQILNAILTGIIQMLPQLISMVVSLVETVATFVINNLPMIIDAGIQLLNAFIDGVLQILPQLINMAIGLIDKVMVVLIQNLPKIIQSGMKLLLALVDGIVKMLPQLVEMALTLILKLAGALLSHLPQIIQAGVKILVALIGGLIQAIPQLIGAIPRIVSAIFSAFGNVNWGEVGTNIIKGIGSGLSAMTGWIKDKISGIASGLIKSAKNVLGIKSPSRVFAKEVGRWIPEGIAVGIQAKSDVASDAVEDVEQSLVLKGSNFSLKDQLIPQLPSLGVAYQKSVNGEGNTSKQPIELVVNLDSHEVSRAIYPHIDDMQSTAFGNKRRYGGSKR